MSRDYCQSMSAVVALGDILVPRYQEFAISHSQRPKKTIFLGDFFFDPWNSKTLRHI